MNVNNDKKLKEFFNNLIKEKSKEVLENEEEEEEEEEEEVEDENKDEPINNTTEKKENIIKNILNRRDLSLITNTVELTSNLDSFKEENSNEETPVSNNLLVSGSSEIIPIVNEKVSRGRKKASTVTVGTVSLKQKAQVVRKTGK
jgi:hypothetical protein